jgi:hypothetical protein
MEVDTQQYEVSDIIKYAYEGQPSEVQDVFNELMMGRVYDSIQNKKIEVAQNYFGSEVLNIDSEEPEDHEQEELEDGENS